MRASRTLMAAGFLFSLACGGHRARVAGQAAPRVKAGQKAASSVRAAPVSLAPASRVPRVSFRDDVEPFLKANCATCHNHDAHASGFSVETPEALFKGGGKRGASVITPGKAGGSALVAYLRGQMQPRMPLNRAPVAPEQIAKIAAWINQGAPVDAVKLGWPYTRPVAQAVPAVKNRAWVHNPIDNFILSALETRQLTPAPPAGKIALLRRVYADLAGMPPTPDEARAFLADTSPKAYEKVVDRLLADPRYGERWGRHWLDLVRYADSDGFENDQTRPRAWRYRDYVIRSLNADKPYDRFLREQLAGDELYPNDADAIVATGYIRLGPRDQIQPSRQDFLNDVTDTTGSVMLGLTVGCARCHNHKYDRITQADYYRTQAFFTPAQWVDTPLPGKISDPSVCAQKLAESQAHIAPLRAERDALRQKHRLALMAKAKAGAKIEISDKDVEDSLKASMSDIRRDTQLEKDIQRLEQEAAPYQPLGEAIGENGSRAEKSHLLLRGNPDTPGPEVQPGFVASLTGGEEKPAPITPPPGDKTTGRRAALAQWIGSPQNPMTARVLVNRLWQHHFGRGLVATPSDFGKNGDRPSHPALLDWLALRFMEDGWSLKKMHRRMLLSNAYQQSTAPNALAFKTDPTNRLLWRMNRIRLEGEALRDSMLAVSGRLNPERGGPGVYPKVSEEALATGSTHKWGVSSEADGLRRTIYVFQRRSLFLPIVEAFDGADMSASCPRRSATTIAPQALALFNGEFSRESAHYLALRVTKEAGSDPAREIERAYQLTLVRRPTAGQITLAQTFLRKQAAQYRRESQPEPDKAALDDLCHILINTNEFIYLD